jgi:hypothetical protein
MSFKSEEEAKERTCIFRWLAKMISPGRLDEGSRYEIDTNCIGLECAQYAVGRHRCGLI